MWKTSLPPGVVVSIASCRLRNPTPRSASPVMVSTRWRRERPRRSSLQTTRCRRAQLVQELRESGPVAAGPAGGLGEHPIAASTIERVDLEPGLLVGGGDAGIAKQMAHAKVGHGFWTPMRRSGTGSGGCRRNALVSATAASAADGSAGDVAAEIAIVEVVGWFSSGSG
jgi:hypothetical protein